MSPESRDLAEAWMRKARSDLATAEILIKGTAKHFDTGAFHCQQAAEKALKGWLTAKEAIFPKTHVLEKILDLCIPLDPAFARLRPQCERLTPLAHEFRYPGDASEPTSQEAEEAFALAEEIYRFCEERVKTLHG